MTKTLALELTPDQVRAALVEGDAHAAQRVSVATVPAGRGISASDLARRITDALGRSALDKARLAVCVGRSHLQLHVLQLPPAPDDELPHLVRFQASRELSGLPEDAPLDFVKLGGDDSGRVMVACLSREGLAQAQAVCRALGSEPTCITLPALAALSLARRLRQDDAQGVELVVCARQGLADLAVLDADRLTLLRSVLLANQDATNGDAIANEIRRTLAAGRQQLNGRDVDQVLLVGQADATRTITDQLVIPCRQLDPATAVRLPEGQQDELTMDGAYAPAFGLALDVADGRRSEIDFLAPRQAVEQPSSRRLHVLAGAAVAAMALLGAWQAYEAWARPARELARVQAAARLLEQNATELTAIEADAAEIDAWLATDINWLDELQRTGEAIRPHALDADVFATNDDAVVTDLTFKVANGNDAVGGEIVVHAAGRSSSVVPPLEERLRDTQHRVTGRVIEQDDAVENYPTRFEIEVQVLPGVDDAE